MLVWLEFHGVGEVLDQGPRPTPEQDAALVRRALSGERRAVDALAARLVCVPRILWALDRQRRRLLGESEIEDLAQDTVLRLWQKLGAFPSYATLEMWAYRFCQYEYLNRLRRLDRRSRVLGAVPDPPEKPVHDPEPDPIDWSTRLDDALDELSTSEAEVIRMKHFEERTFEELAEALGVSSNTAKARYYRGLAKLRERLERRHAPEDLP